ncbi:uncharacterized protein G2W53_011925 [Senna tora]|uniref:Uncharacterized protein n=1 Tax=Senna tora TaxID=362788 RepID=A0A834TWV9_9FABA|nr:uncharacterized protein G2W53_011925 [Senna tora]
MLEWQWGLGVTKGKSHGLASKHEERSRRYMCIIELSSTCSCLEKKLTFPWNHSSHPTQPIPPFLSSKSAITKASSLSRFASNRKECACSYPALHTFCTLRFPCSFKL